uniref:ATP synthase F0 subunit 8 n=1 Tax=Acanthopleura loochooana TaxID=167017 RepID=UPI002237D6CB|nr:ATP synthase F0 subunit 8 [Acanthopleura loochooana]UYG48459.1 ATP synthase F0 subunit 8 [Acanthopleura loochooana]
MPQLAPLNWILLMLFFWSTAFLIMVSLWWMKKKEYRINLNSKLKSYKKKSWMW